MFKRFKRWLSNKLSNNYYTLDYTEETKEVSDSSLSSNAPTLTVESRELCENLWEYLLQRDKLDGLLEKYISKHSTSAFFEELTYIFNSTNTRCAFVRMHREVLCISFLRCKIEPIEKWLSILSIDTTNDLYYGDFSIEFLVEHIPEEILKPFVIENFSSILKRTETDMYYLFAKHEEWKELFIKNLPFILKSMPYKNIYDYIELIKFFPENALTIYETFLECYIEWKLQKDTRLKEWDNFSIVSDILIPISDFEKFGQSSKVVIPSRIPELLTAISNFTELYKAQDVLINDFNVSERFINTIVNDLIKNYIETLMYNKRKIGQLVSILNELLKNKYAFDYFFDNLYEIVYCQGLDLYNYLLKQFGNVKFITCTKYSCFDYI